MGAERFGWKEHFIRQGDGSGGWIVKSAQYQLLRHRDEGECMGFGLAQMDNGEVVLLGTWKPGDAEETVIAFSSDRGDTWCELETIPGITDRPMMLAYLGQGNLTFVTDARHYSSDYGRTWPERIPVPPASNGATWGAEGNPLVERDEHGVVTRMAEIGYNFGDGGYEPKKATLSFIRWSYDSGRTWTDEVEPLEWRQQETYQGKAYARGVSEGSLVRAANGWLVAALRPDMPLRYLDGVHCDNFEGTGVSISEDDGRTWSPVNVLYDAGRMHPHLLGLPNGDLVMTVTVRHDIRGRKLASYRRGCDAIISHDNGLTWDLDRTIVLDEWEFFNPSQWAAGLCGHIYSTLLDDGAILTVHNNYLTKAMGLIRWRL